MSKLPFILAAVAASLAAIWASGLLQSGGGASQVEASAPTEVTVIAAETDTHIGHLLAFGEANARFDLQLTAQVGGRIVAINTVAESGNAVTPDQTLFEIEDTPFRMALANAKRTLVEAKLTLAQEQGQAERAKAEWESVDLDIPPSSLAFREPQMEAARSAIEAAEIGVENAEFDLSQTLVAAPFDALVIERLVDPGDLVSAGTPLARIVSLDRVEVRVPLSRSQWHLVDATIGRPVTVKNQYEASNWSGYVLRIEQHVNQDDRQRAIVIAIDQPLALDPPLFPGTFVTVSLPSKPIDNAYRLPSSALASDGRLWRIDNNDQAEPFVPQVVYRFDDSLIAVPPDGLTESRIVRKPLARLTEGTGVIPVVQVDKP